MRVYHGDKRDSVVRTRNPIPEDTAGTAPRSILPSSTRGVNNIMVGGRTDRRYYGPTTQGFWKPPPDVKDALRCGNKKCRGVGS